ncbi:hypothetical protein Dimus_021800 [Dionaea muscipula]
MAQGGLKLIDGTQLRTSDFSLPDTDGYISGARVLELAESRSSQSLYGLSLPENLKSSALKRLDIIDLVTFRGQKLAADDASRVMTQYITAIADELKDDPLLVAVLDGSTLRQFLEDEDDFAMLAENLFNELDTEDEGKVRKSEIQNALVQMGIEMGVPPFSEFPMLKEILNAHGAEGDEKLGQAQFAQLLQLILQDLADALAENHVIAMQNVKIINGSKLRKLLGDGKQLDDVTEKIYQQMLEGHEAQSCKEIIRRYLEKNGEGIGLPYSEANEAVILLFDDVFASVDKNEISAELEKKEFGELVKEILGKFAEQLDACPVLHVLEN